MKLSKSVIAEIVLSLLLMAALFYFADVGKVVSVIEKIELKWLALALIFYFAINLSMAVRVWAILRDLGAKLSYRSTLMAHFSGMIASDFTPARSGYLTTAFVLSRNNGLPLEKTIVSIIGPQIFDFLLKVTAGAIAFWYLLTYVLDVNTEESILLAVIFGIFAISTMVLVMFLSLFSPRFLRMMGFIKRLPFGKVVYELVENIQKNSHTIRRLFWLIMFLLGLTWLLKALEWYFLSLAVGFTPDIPFAPIIFFAFLQPLVTILQFAPLPTFAGAGFSEAATVFVLLQFGVPVEQGLVFALLTRFVMIAVDSLGVAEAVKLLRLEK
ncbi:MAG: lysylphosphatidylglycerol synthase transmembrane domain-containing protein [Candidatus Burarchaeum sp.]|nr:lysylphosphatidylglycerol synthase transmembrane domain-containing protein [Candidatus Burarchaeum sp.]MDO8339607.1 lysylphosphatidylglycerol synthase transmembrane domain-containing protein [Candidatus Burarchaeum sp.]